MNWRKAIIKACRLTEAGPTEEKPSDSPEATLEQTEPEVTEPAHRGQLILDATVVEQAIRFPTDLSLLNEARELSEHIIDTLRANLKVDNKPIEFGAKLSVSLTGEGLAHVDHLRWDAFHEGLDLATQVEAYRERYGHYPERVIADPIYGTRANRDYLKQRGIHFAGKPLGRLKQVTDANREQLKQAKAQRRQDYLQRIPIEGKFGQGKKGYRLNHIRAKRANTSFAWINTIFPPASE